MEIKLEEKYYVKEHRGKNLIVTDGKDFFLVRETETGYSRPWPGGDCVRSASLDYLAIGARKCKTLKTAQKWADDRDKNLAIENIIKNVR